MTLIDPVRERASRIFLLNPDSILGLIMFGVVLGMQDDNISALEKAVTSFVGVLALWIGHVFAHTMAGNGVTEDHRVTWRTSLKKSLQRSWPMFAWTAPSMLVLLFAAIFNWPGAVASNFSLITMMTTLFLIGSLIIATRGRSLARRVAGGLATCAVGVIVVMIEILVRGIH